MKDNAAILLVENAKMEGFLNINALPSHLRTIWIAAYFIKKLGRQQVATVDLLLSSQQIITLMKKKNLNLRMSGGLLVGIINLYIKQLNFFVQDCSALLKRLMHNTREDALVVKRPCTVTKRVLRHGGKKTLKIKRRKPNTAERILNTSFLPKKFQFDSTHQYSRLDENGSPKELGSRLYDAMHQNEIALDTSTTERYSNLETLSLECCPNKVLPLRHPCDNEMELLASGQPTNWINKSTLESKWFDEVDDTLQSESQNFALRDLGIISQGSPVAAQNMEGLKIDTSVSRTHPLEIQNFYEIETLRAAATPYSMLSITKNPSVNDPHASVSCLTAQRQRFSMNDLNSSHTTIDDNNFLRFSMEASEPVFHTPYVKTGTLRESTVFPITKTPRQNPPSNLIDNNSRDFFLHHLEEEDATGDDPDDSCTIMLSDFDECEPIYPQAHPTLRSFVRRHQMGFSSKKLDLCVQLDPKVLKEWQTFSLPLLRPFHTNYQRDVDNASLYHHNMFPLFVLKHFRIDDTKTSPNQTLCCALNGYDSERDRAMRTPINKKEFLNESHVSHNDSPMLNAPDFLVSPSTLRDVNAKSFVPLHVSESFSMRTLVSPINKSLNNNTMMTDLFKALYDKDNILPNTTETSKLNDLSKTPLKTPLKRYIKYHSSASPKSNVSFESGDAATTVNGENTSTCESSSAGSFSLYALSPAPTFTQTPIGEQTKNTEDTFSKKKNTSLALLQAFETPIHAPGNQLYNKKNIATSGLQTDKALSTCLFHYASASESIKIALCREVGFCKRTIRLLEHISYRLVQPNNRPSSRESQPCIKFDKLVESQSQTTVAATFFELLTLTTRMFIDIKQENTSRKNYLLITFGERYKELITEAA